jgi:lipopolysaccharide/colanic/teichoic acid biosynthesis glycosyltransferase
MNAIININHRQPLPHRSHPITYRVFDALTGTILFLFLSPMLLLAAITTLICNRCWVFKKVFRAKTDGRVVSVFNFRLKQPINRYNYFLVRSRLVALPEIINVITGELSLFDPNGVTPSLFVA